MTKKGYGRYLDERIESVNYKLKYCSHEDVNLLLGQLDFLMSEKFKLEKDEDE